MCHTKFFFWAKLLSHCSHLDLLSPVRTTLCKAMCPFCVKSMSFVIMQKQLSKRYQISWWAVKNKLLSLGSFRSSVIIDFIHLPQAPILKVCWKKLAGFKNHYFLKVGEKLTKLDESRWLFAAVLNLSQWLNGSMMCSKVLIFCKFGFSLTKKPWIRRIRSDLLALDFWGKRSPQQFSLLSQNCLVTLQSSKKVGHSKPNHICCWVLSLLSWIAQCHTILMKPLFFETDKIICRVVCII